tara:strand:- start:536 stop:733 length:198 start_codon:yes stop_codon:yes gene_type:complete
VKIADAEMMFCSLRRFCIVLLLIGCAGVSIPAMADLLDFFSLRDSIVEDASNGKEVAPGVAMLGV